VNGKLTRKGHEGVKTKRAALYVRVSSGEQSTGAQERALREYVQRRGWKLQQIYRDQGVSGASSNRPALNEMLKACRRGSVDVIVVWKFGRFARSLKQLMSGLEMCRALGIDFVSVTEAVDTSIPSGELLLQLVGAVAQFERSLIGERLKSGLANARAKGKSLGRPPLRKLSTGETRQLRTERARQRAVSSSCQEIRRVSLDSPQALRGSLLRL
jgi:DNA invertase Pin-like site-specific DNA recombinase